MRPSDVSLGNTQRVLTMAHTSLGTQTNRELKGCSRSDRTLLTSVSSRIGYLSFV